MYLYILKRLLLMIPTLLGAAVLVFFLMRADPRRHLRAAAGDRRRQHRSAGVVKACRTELGTGPADAGAVLALHQGPHHLRLRQVDVDRPADRRGGRPALPALAAGRHHGDADGDPARHPARHDLGGQAEHLDRLSGARLLHRRHRHAVVLARHPDHPRHPDHLQGAVRLALDAAHQVRADLGGPALQPEHADLAGAGDRLSLFGGGHAHDALGHARGAARGLRAHRARQGRCSAS